MSFADMLRALGEEAGREADALRARAEAGAARAVEEALREGAAARDAALAEARARHEAVARAALAGAARERARALLGDARAALDELRAEALARAVAGRAPAALLDALAAEVGDRDAEWVADAGEEDELRARLAGRPSARLRTAAERRGGVEVIVEGRTTLDVTAAARLERAWPELEPALCRIVVGDGDGGL